MSSSERRSIVSSFQRASIGQDDFGIPQSPPAPSSSTSPWTLHVSRPRDNSPTRLQKARTPDLPGRDSESISNLTVPSAGSSNMRRRASCPDFKVPDFKLSESESTRLLNKRPSIISQSVIDNFNVGDRRHVTKAPTGSPILEQPEITVTDSENSPCPVALTEKRSLPTDNSAVVPSQQQGFLLSKVSSLFISKQPSQKPTDFMARGVNTNLDTADAAGGAAPIMPPKKKSYFARRAAALTNADVNAMAPTSL